MNELVLTNTSGQNVTTSLIIAEIFCKMHKNVLSDIEKLDCSQEFNQLNFQPISYIDSMNREQKAYELTKDGFSFLVMGYSGNKAAQFKERFISEFNKREMMLKSDDYILSRAFTIMQDKVKQLQTTTELQAKELKEAAPKVEYYEQVLQSDGLILTNTIAEELGISARKLNFFLAEKHIVYKQNDTYHLFAKYRGCGYEKYKTHPYTDSHGETKTAHLLCWTEAGRQFILKFWGIYNKKAA